MSEIKKRLLVVGVNGSSRQDQQPKLKHAEKDAGHISWQLRQNGFEAIGGGALHGKAASTQGVAEAVKDLIKNSGPEDLRMFYFIGHSYTTPTNSGNKIYLVTADFDPDIVEDQPGVGLSLDWIWETFLRNKKLSNVIVILDCCNAGGVLPSEDDLRPHQSAQASRAWAIIASTEANEPAYEGIDHTYMTGLVLNVLKGKDQRVLDENGALSLLNLFQYLQRRMPELGPQKQNPIMAGIFPRQILVQNPERTDNSFRPSPSPDNAGGHTLPPPSKFFDETTCQEALVANLGVEQVRTFLCRPRIQIQEDYHPDYNEQQQMEAFGLLLKKHPSYGALLCFGNSPARQVTGAYTRCIYWRGSNRQSGSQDEGESRGSLLEQFAQARNFLVQHLGKQVSEGDELERGKLFVRVLEEALTNALIHREYATEPGRRLRPEGVMVELFHDRIEILSPGGPPLDIAVLREADKQHPGSHARNPQIMRIFYLSGHVESAGTGIARMQQWMQEADLPPLELGLNEETQTFSVTLHRPTMTIESVSDAEASDLDRQTVTGAREEEKAPTYQPDARASDQNRQVSSGDKVGEHGLAVQSYESSALGGPSQPHHLVRTVLFIALSVVLVCGVLGLGAFTIAPQWYVANFVPASTIIEIASELPTTGVDTTLGLPVQNGAQMAIDDANQKQMLPGYTFKLTVYNDVGRFNRHDPQKGASNLRQAIADDLVAGVVGPYNSAVALVELPIANQADIALISPSNTYPCLTKDVSVDPDCVGSDSIEAQMRPTDHFTYFRLATTDDREGKVAANFFAGLHYHKVLLLKDNSDPYSRVLAKVFQETWRKLGGQVFAHVLPENASSAQDYQNTLQVAAGLQPDLIYFAGNDPNGSYVLQAISNISQLKSVAFAGASGIMDNSFLQTAAQARRSAPIYVSSPIEDPTYSGQVVGTNFENNYIAKGYANYRPYAAAAYDATMMLIRAIKTALQQKGVFTPHGTQDQAGARRFRQAILQALAHLSYTGATGTQSFDANGDTSNHTVSFYQVDIVGSLAEWKWLEQVKG